MCRDLPAEGAATLNDVHELGVLVFFPLEIGDPAC